jgi:pimeloyl-ACP methyl ester carboxylesterase
MAKASSESRRDRTDWDRFEEALAEGTVRGKRSATVEQELKGFDGTELAVLRRLATRARLSRSRAPLLGNVVFLHGITGSDLATVAGPDRDHVWINVPRLMTGYIERLALAPDGRHEASRKYRVVATRPNKRYYARAILALRARWDAVGYAYDWRRDIDEAADGLAQLIRERFPGKPVHLVAHSMGGLVARNMILRHPKLWDGLEDPDKVAGGRLVMLGTPNYGSYAIVQALTGEDRMMAMLEKLDFSHDMRELLAITNSFVGSYQLLPAPSKLPGALDALYQADTWPKRAAVSQLHLNRAHQFHVGLDNGSTVSATRMIYVAGCQQPTIVGMNIAGRGDFDYVLSREGDGRVPHALGLLPGVPTYYIDEVHGDLARNEQVLRALDDLLESGSTSVLATRPTRGAKRGAPNLREYQRATDGVLMDEFDRIVDEARPVRGSRAEPKVSDEDAAIAEDALLRASLGAGRASHAKRPGKTKSKGPRTAPPVPLQVTLRLADIRDVKAPVVVVGHYRGLAPVNAIGAIDERLDGWIALAVKRGMIGGLHGELFHVPTRGRIAAEAVLIAGMGTPGSFNEDRLRSLMANVALGTGALGMKQVATVLVGAGEGSLEPDRALRAMVCGIAGAIGSVPEAERAGSTLQEIIVVEHNPERIEQLAGHLRQLKEDAGTGARLTLTLPTAAEIERARRRRRGSRGRAGGTRAEKPRQMNEIRLTLESPAEGGRFRFSAITRSAVVPVREVEVDAARFQALAAALQDSEAGADQEQYGRLMFEYLMPQDFDQSIEEAESVRLIVDSTTASFPWEMACFRPRSGDAGVQRLGLEKKLTRQFRTMLSQPPGTMPPLEDEVRVLVIADPAPETELQLRYARLEGRRVAETLRMLSRPGCRITVESRIGASECNLVEILKLILTGDFDVLHYAGHGEYDPSNPTAAGWILGRDQVLSARDIFRARRVPRLVFANACFSGVIHDGPAFESAELTRGTATVAQAFFERGVPNYVGSGWPVDDEQAGTFAAAFYERLFAGDTMREALREARQRIFAEMLGSTWGAYQHYGDPEYVLIRPGAAPAPAPRRRRR